MKNHWLDKKKEKEAEEAFGKFVVGCDPCVDFSVDFNSIVPSSQQVSISGSPQISNCISKCIITGDSTLISNCTINWAGDKVFDNSPVVTCVVQCPKGMEAEWTYTITS